MTLYLICGTILLITTLISSVSWRVWWVKGFNAASWHIFVGMAILLAVGLCFSAPPSPGILAMQAALIIAIIYQFLKILPFTFLHKTELKEANDQNIKSIRCMAANVRMSNSNYAGILSLIKKYKPNIILLTETNGEWLNAIEPLQAIYPYNLLQPQENTYGMALYSQYPFLHAETNFLVDKKVPSFHVQIISPNEKIIQFIGLHPRPPAPWTNAENKDLELIKAAIMTNWNSLPSIVSGDLNDVGWSRATREFKQISGLLDPRIGRGFFNTYNALIPLFRMPIDHFFVSHHFKLVKMKRLEKFGSDHFPVLVEVTLDE